MRFTFTETPYFTDRLVERMSDDEYARLQNFLLILPTVGDVIQGTGGYAK